MRTGGGNGAGLGRACAQVSPGTGAHVVYTGAAGEPTRKPRRVEQSPSTPAFRHVGRLALGGASAVVRSWFIHLPAHPSVGVTRRLGADVVSAPAWG